MRDVVIIGSGPAGYTAAIYLGRAGFEPLVVAGALTPGGQLVNTTEVENFPGFPDGIMGPDLMDNMRKQAERFGTHIVWDDVVSVASNADSGIKTVTLDGGDVYDARALVIATGSNYRKLGVPGETEYAGKGVSYCATCDGAFFRNKDVFVIGGGFTAAEESVFLTKFARHVTMLIRKNDFACPASVADKARNHEKITVLFNTVMQEVSGDDGLRRIQYQNTATGEIIDYQSPDGETIGVFVFAGYAPDTALVSGIAERDARGYIITDENQKTSVEGLYAAGDICVKPLRQVITAASDGAVAAAALEKYCGALRGESCI